MTLLLCVGFRKNPSIGSGPEPPISKTHPHRREILLVTREQQKAQICNSGAHPA